jgi:hypothetical protein
MSISNFCKLLPIFSLLSFMPVMATEYLKINAHGQMVLVHTTEEPKDVMANLRPDYLMIHDEISEDEVGPYILTPWRDDYRTALKLLQKSIVFLRQQQVKPKDDSYANTMTWQAYEMIAGELKWIHKLIYEYFTKPSFKEDGFVFLFSSSSTDSEFMLILILMSYFSKEFQENNGAYEELPALAIFVKGFINILDNKEHFDFLREFMRQRRDPEELAKVFERFEHPEEPRAPLVVEEPPVIELTPRPMRASTWATTMASFFGFSQKHNPRR